MSGQEPMAVLCIVDKRCRVVFSRLSGERFIRRLCYVLVFSIPLLVLVINFNTAEVREALVYRGVDYLLSFRLMYMPAKYFLWALLVLGMIAVTVLSNGKIDWKREHLYMALFWVWGVASLLWSINHYETQVSLIQWSLIFLTIFMVSTVFRNREHYRRVFWLMWIALGIAILISLLEQYTTFIAFAQSMGFRNASTFANYKFMTHFGLILLPLCIPLFLWAKSTKEKISLGLVMALFLVHLKMSGFNAKAFWLGLLLNLTFLFMYRLRKFRTFKPILIVSMLVMFSTALFIGVKSYHQMSPERLDSTVQQRWIMWENTLGAIKDHPIAGTGLGTFPIVYYKYETPEDRKLFPKDENQGWSFFTGQAHNDVLQIFQELGMVGGLLFLFFFGGLCVVGMKRVFRQDNRKNHAFDLALVLSLMNLWILLCVFFPLHQPISAMMFAVVTGLAIQRWGSKIVFKPPLFYTAMVLIFVFLANGSCRAFFSKWHWNRSNFVVKTNYSREREIRKAQQWWSHSWEQKWLLARHYYRQRKFSKARDMFLGAFSLNPNVPHLASGLGLTYVHLKDYQRALYYMDAALRLAPDFTLAHHNKGLVYFELKQLKKALLLFKRAQASQHMHLDVSYYMAGLCMGQFKRFDEAEIELLEAIAIKPRHFQYQKILLRIEGVRKKFTEPEEASLPSQTSIAVSKTVALLTDPIRAQRTKAMHVLAQADRNQIAALLSQYPLVKDPDLKWRLFYILSIHFPKKMLTRARDVFYDDDERSGVLKLLSIRHLSKHSSQDLEISNLPGPIRQDYSQFIRLLRG